MKNVYVVSGLCDFQIFSTGRKAIEYAKEHFSNQHIYFKSEEKLYKDCKVEEMISVLNKKEWLMSFEYDSIEIKKEKVF